MWSNVCCSKYSHSRVTTFKTHLKHNNQISRLVYDEKHLQPHMQLPKFARIIRFLFYPLCLFTVIMHQNDYPEFKESKDLCFQRHICHAYCISDSFPDNVCNEVEYNIEYNQNKYKGFYTYANPTPPNSFFNLGLINIKKQK